MATIKINNAHYYYELQGQGKPLVFIAGYTCDHRYYLPILDKITKHFQVLIFDNRGIGSTTDGGEQLSAELMAEDTLALIKALGLSKPHVVAHSMGGTIAQVIASQYPDQIEKLVLLNTSAKWRQAMVNVLGALLALRQQLNKLDSLVDASLALMYAEEFLSNEESVNALKQLILNNPKPQPVEDQKRQHGVISTFDGRAALKKIKAPTLISYGLQDVISLPLDAEYLHQNINNSKLISLNCGHALLPEVPDELTEELLKFLL